MKLVKIPVRDGVKDLSPNEFLQLVNQAQSRREIYRLQLQAGVINDRKTILVEIDPSCGRIYVSASAPQGLVRTVFILSIDDFVGNFISAKKGRKSAVMVLGFAVSWPNQRVSWEESPFSKRTFRFGKYLLTL
jgi:hypothetical protein